MSDNHRYWHLVCLTEWSILLLLLRLLLLLLLRLLLLLLLLLLCTVPRDSSAVNFDTVYFISLVETITRLGEGVEETGVPGENPWRRTLEKSSHFVYYCVERRRVPEWICRNVLFVRARCFRRRARAVRLDLSVFVCSEAVF